MMFMKKQVVIGKGGRKRSLSPARTRCGRARHGVPKAPHLIQEGLTASEGSGYQRGVSWKPPSPLARRRLLI